MSIKEVLIKILLFFGVFYGAIGITAFIGKKIKQRGKGDKDESSS